MFVLLTHGETDILFDNLTNQIVGVSQIMPFQKIYQYFFFLQIVKSIYKYYGCKLRYFLLKHAWHLVKALQIRNGPNDAILLPLLFEP